MNQVTKEMKQQVRENLAQQLYGLMTDESGSTMSWKGTKTQLVELAYYLYMTGRMVDDYGTPLSLAEVVRQACRRFCLSPITNITNIINNINKCQGIKQHTLLSMSEYDYVHRGHYHDVRRYINPE